MTSSSLDFTKTRENPTGLREVGGILPSGERVFLIERARRFFAEGAPPLPKEMDTTG